MSARQRNWNWTAENPTRRVAEARIVHYFCAFNPDGVNVGNCIAMTRMPSSNASCCSTACASPYRACRVCIYQGGVPNVVAAGEAESGLCEFHAKNGEGVQKPSADDSDDDEFDPKVAPFATRISAAYLAGVRTVSVDSVAMKQPSRVNAILAQLNTDGRTKLTIARAVGDLKRQFQMSHEAVGRLLEIEVVEVAQYNNLNYLVPQVMELVDTLGLFRAAQASFARGEKQLEVAKMILDGRLPDHMIEAYVRHKRIRAENRRYRLHR